jgi:hypothetical protein
MAELVKNKTNNPNGRPVGTSNKLRVTDFFNGSERDQLVMEAKLLAFGTADTKPDKEMIKFLWEQLFGKATQRTELTGAEGEVLKIVFDNALNSGNDTPS